MKHNLFLNLVLFTIISTLAIAESKSKKKSVIYNEFTDVPKFPFQIPDIKSIDFKKLGTTLAKQAEPLINKALDTAGLPNLNTLKTLITCGKDLIDNIKKVRHDPKSIVKIIIHNNATTCINAVEKVIDSCNSPVIIGLTAAPYVGGPLSFICSRLSIITQKIEMMKMKALQLSTNFITNIPKNVNTLLAKNATVANITAIVGNITSIVATQDTLISN